jgi:hypothetical protein
MNVKELIALLSNEDPEAKVHVVYPSGDYWRTQLAPEVMRVDGEAMVVPSMNQTHELLDTEDNEHEHYNEAQCVVALRF